MNPTFDDGASPGGAFGARVDEIQRLALLVGVVALAATAGGLLIRPQAMASAYLVGFLFWVGIGLGSLGLCWLHHLVGGQWGLPIRRPLEAGAMTLVPMAVLFIPLAFVLPMLYPWARPEEVRLDLELAHKAAYYLNVPFFLIRTAAYFVAWIGMALLVSRLSRSQDAGPDPRPSRTLQNLAAPGLIVLFFTASFAAIDWGMSLEPRWASTIYGPMVVTGQALATLAFMILVATGLGREALREAATPSRLNDLGNLLLAFTMLWAYMSFSQFLIIWSGNLVEEMPWYLRRVRGGWQWVALTLIVVHFFLPFFVLLFREIKRQASLLPRVAGLILAMHLLDLTWLVVPALTEASQPQIPWGVLPFILVATVGIGGVWLAVFLRQLRSAPLVPLHDPHLEAALQHAGGDEHA